MAHSAMRIYDLSVELGSFALGIGETRPRLGWKLRSDSRAEKQSAYHILVASSSLLLEENCGDLWDSGEISSDQSVHIVYEGAPLLSRQRCYWKLKARDSKGAETVWSETSLWTMGLLNEEDYSARFIGHPSSPEEGNPEAVMRQPSPYLRTVFELDSKPEIATLYATALGLYEARLNGNRVGSFVLAPGWTDYRKRVHVQAYDVTTLLTEGENAIGAIIGTGWYAGQVGWYGPGQYGTKPCVLLQLEMTFSDGTKRLVVSDGGWRASFGPILFSDMQDGETYDARLNMPGWDKPGFDDSKWSPAQSLDLPYTGLTPGVGPAVAVIESLPPLASQEPSPGCYVFDMGQNMVGWVRLRMNNIAEGTRIRLRFAETVHSDGTLYTDNLRSARQTDEYIAEGALEEIFEPRFTFHGFRYVEVTGNPGLPESFELTGCVVHSEMPETGAWNCSHPGVNRLQSNILWGQKGNFLSVPTDCPQRNERMGWTGDAQIFAGTAAYRMNVASFFTKWMDDVEDASFSNGAFPDVAPNPQPASLNEGKPGWGDAGVIVPWTMFRMYGDKRIIEKHYQAMADWIAYLEANSVGGLRPDIGYGDWLSVNAETPKDVMATAYFAYSARLMARMAAIIGRRDDAERYEKLFGTVKQAFSFAYVSEDGRIKGDTQAVYTLALYMELLPDRLRAAAAARLAEDIERRGGHLTTGFLGVGYLMPVLSGIGRTDLAYRLLLQENYPSWLYSVSHGATTIWERWDGWTEEKGFQTPDMNSFNHYSLGSVGEWLFRHAAGIDTDDQEVGFKQIVIRPRIGEGLDFVEAAYECSYGTIRSEWRAEPGKISLRVTVPVNASARIHIPMRPGYRLLEGGIPVEESSDVELTTFGEGEAVCRVGSGSFEFHSVAVEWQNASWEKAD
ncbi:alpha-L-rhamnosidase [Cohnella silvisoli]|uniref:alpha-L-rhamnosidase n=1 Tax=Cohnella silvisoli TaxID=2873699 RepID=A0ABV1KSW0_9BACL|nr:alpha-L-rhamnosidase [Cohnella silvisoli]MCD9021362.1 glycoside hydrolase family 78 protein [Cohnella silvisoli]